MEKFFKNKNDIYKFTYGSGKKVLVKCPDCQREKYMIVKDLYNHKSIGCICSDNISYPEKFMISALTQLNIDFIYQYSPKWIKPYRYDFYFEINQNKYIVEVDGGIGHGNRNIVNNKITAEELYQRDKYKDKKAEENNIKIVRINAYPSNFDTLKYNVINSLGFILDVNNIDYNKCDLFAMCNLAKEICDKWNNGMSIINISECMKISIPTVRKYLKNGNKLKWCLYDPQEEKIKRIKRRGKNIIVYKDNNLIGKFDSCKEFAMYYNSIQNDIYINSKSMANSLKNNKKYKGLLVKENEI